MSKKIPVYNLNVPNGGPQMPITIPSNASIYSTYTGEYVGKGYINTNTICDAPESHKNYGKPYHVVEYNPANDSYMAHGISNNGTFNQSSSYGYGFGNGWTYR